MKTDKIEVLFENLKFKVFESDEKSAIRWKYQTMSLSRVVPFTCVTFHFERKGLPIIFPNFEDIRTTFVQF